MRAAAVPARSAIHPTRAALLRSRRCVHCRDWIRPERLARLPDATECRECADELRRGVVRP